MTLRLAISNIAWDVSEDAAVASLLRRQRIDAIDVAPAKYFPELAKATDEDVRKVRRWWANEGISITGMQALLFGTQGLNVFGAPEVQAALLSHLAHVCRIGAGLDGSRLVFGSPKNRDRSGLSDEETSNLAAEFFRSAGDIAASCGVIICLEPNPPRYGANFMTNSAETAAIVRLVNHPAIRMQFDAGSLAINGEDAEQVLDQYFELIGHIHLSEPDLLPIGDGETDHSRAANALHRYLPDTIATIEMLATKEEPHLDSIERAIRVADAQYRQNPVKSPRIQ